VEVATRLGRKNLRRGESGRGLEQLTPRGYQETTSSRMNSTFAVLSEQYRQDQLLSIRDESKLAEVYATTSQMATIRAQDKAAVDALDAQYHQTEDPYMDDECDDTSFDCWFMSPAKWLIPFGKARVAPV
jgi:predicted aminopeptidase